MEMHLNAENMILIDDEVKFDFLIKDKKFKPDQVVVYAKKHVCDFGGDDETYLKVITVDTTGSCRKFMKDLTPVEGNWIQGTLL